MINRICHELINFLELTGKSINEVFFLGAHFICGKIADRFDFICQLRCHLAKECIWLIYLVLKIFFSSTNSVKHLRTELLEVIFKTRKVSLHGLKFIFVCLEIYILLLCNLFAKSDLLECILELVGETRIILVLCFDCGLSWVILLFVD